jgi:ABC-type transport system involved in multi-copper enzyme maturation permease subunit
MATAAETWGAWLHRNLAWSTTRQAWEERASLVLLVLGAVALVVWGDPLPLPQQVLLWGALLAGLAFLGRRGWLKLFGPVLFYDLICTARRRRYVLIRCLYAVGLAVVLGWMYAMWHIRGDRIGRVRLQDLAQLAEQFFFTFMSIQFAVVLLLTPAYTAGAIAEEKDRKTLEFLLATDLRNREIVLSKLATRLANITMLVLTGLPVLSFIQFFGGIDPNLLLVSFAALGLTMVSLGALSIFNSVVSRRPRDAIVLTYLEAGAYLALSGFSLLLLVNPKVANFPLWFGSDPLRVKDLVEAFSSGNLFVVIAQMGRAWDRGRTLADILPTLLRNYALFHGLLAVICAGWAVARVRAVALKQAHGKAPRASLGVRLLGRPRVVDQPMIWKEVFAEPGLRFGWFGWTAIVLLVLASFIPPVIIYVQYLDRLSMPTRGLPPGWSHWEFLGREMNTWCRGIGTIVACLMLLAVAVRASGAISGERDKQTFDALLTSPMDSTTILFAKWLGSILSVRWAWLWLVLIWAPSIAVGGLQPLALPLLVGCWLVYAGACACVGLWYSMVSRTTLRATLWTLLTVVAAGGGHWLLTGMCCYMPLATVVRTGPKAVESFMMFQAGQTPPFVLGFFAFRGDEFERRYSNEETWKLLFWCLVGVASWWGGTAFLWKRVSGRFRVLTGRQPFRPPRLSPPDKPA